MTQPDPADRICDCCCPVHHGSRRDDYDSGDCACLVGCATQPVTLVIPGWRCALFLHPGSGVVWFVMASTRGAWDWSSATEIDERSDVFETGRSIETVLRRLESIIAGAAENDLP